MNESELTGLIGYVPQNPALVTGTIEKICVWAEMNIPKKNYGMYLDWHRLRTSSGKENGLKTRFPEADATSLVVSVSGWRLPERCSSTVIIIFDDSTSALDYATDSGTAQGCMSDPQLNKSMWIIILRGSLTFAMPIVFCFWTTVS